MLAVSSDNPLVEDAFALGPEAGAGLGPDRRRARQPAVVLGRVSVPADVLLARRLPPGDRCASARAGRGELRDVPALRAFGDAGPEVVPDLGVPLRRADRRARLPPRRALRPGDPRGVRPQPTGRWNSTTGPATADGSTTPTWRRTTGTASASSSRPTTPTATASPRQAGPATSSSAPPPTTSGRRRSSSRATASHSQYAVLRKLGRHAEAERIQATYLNDWWNGDQFARGRTKDGLDYGWGLESHDPRPAVRAQRHRGTQRAAPRLHRSPDGVSPAAEHRVVQLPGPACSSSTAATSPPGAGRST